MRRWPCFAIAAAAITLFGYGLTPGNRVAAAQAAGTARIVAKVVLTGTPPPPARLQMNADPVCAKKHQTTAVLSQTVETGADGALKNTLVFVKDGVTGAYPAPSTPATLDQVGCVYTPHVFGVMAGQPVQIINSDPTLHNIHPMPVTNAGFNIGMPIEGMKQTRVFSKAEAPFHVKCDVHPWMSAYIGVFSHPFFGVSNEQGEVELKNLPAGTFQVQAWQEKYGALTQSVTVAVGETRQITFTFKAS
jgi:plastocyanin